MRASARSSSTRVDGVGRGAGEHHLDDDDEPEGDEGRQRAGERDESAPDAGRVARSVTGGSRALVRAVERR